MTIDTNSTKKANCLFLDMYLMRLLPLQVSALNISDMSSFLGIGNRHGNNRRNGNRTSVNRLAVLTFQVFAWGERISEPSLAFRTVHVGQVRPVLWQVENHTHLYLLPGVETRLPWQGEVDIPFRSRILKGELSVSNLLRAGPNSFEVVLQHSNQGLVLLVHIS
jgi:hypothetical protein